MTQERYAVYYAPAADSPWRAFAAPWLGRDEVTGESLHQPCPPGFGADEFSRMTEEPRRYGFHATLRPPMRVNTTPGSLVRQVDRLASQLRAVPLGTLVPVFMDGFLALVPAQRNPALQWLAAQCVTGLETLREPLDARERARRRPDQLDARGLELLDLYGYPSVLERFRFHLTLTGPIDMTVAGRLVTHLTTPVARLNEQSPPVLDRLCVFHEPSPGAPFMRIHEAGLQA